MTHAPLLAAVVAAFAASSEARDGDLARALAQVVDDPTRPQEAAALEEVPYRLLLERVRMGPAERTLVLHADVFTYEGLREQPEGFRGSIVFTAGVIVHLGRAAAPGVGARDRNEVHAGIVLAQTRRGAALWAFRALRRPGDAVLYVGDTVFLSGYFLKNVPVLDARQEVHWMPLVVAPWPTYGRTRHARRWIPAWMVRKLAGGLLPVTDYPHEEVRARPVVDFLGGGAVALDGVALPEGLVRDALGRFALRSPGRAFVARARGAGARATGGGMVAGAGMAELAVWKDLPADAGDGDVPAP